MFFEEEEEEIIFEDFEEVEEVDNNEGEDEETMEIKEIVPEVVSLQYFCLQTISDNLERFNAALTTTEDINFQRHLHYIRRVHTSFFLNNKLREDKGVLKKKYWNILLNEHMKELHLSKIEFKDWDDFIKKLDEVGHGFEMVSFDYDMKLDFEPVIRFVNKVLFKLPNIKALYLSKYCKDTTLEILATCCPKLEELNIDNSQITDKGVIRMCQEKDNGIGTHYLKLKLISVSSNRGKINDGIAYLVKNMPSLEIVRYPFIGCVMFDMYKNNMSKAIEDKYNLTYLSIPLEMTKMKDNVLHALIIFKECCPHLKELSTPVTCLEELQVISNFMELTDLSIQSPWTSNCSETVNWYFEHKGKCLKKLQIENIAVSPVILLRSCPNLELLSLNSVKSNDATLWRYDDSVRINRTDYLFDLGEVVFAEYVFYNRLDEENITAILNSSPNVKKATFIHCIFAGGIRFKDVILRFCRRTAIEYLRFKFCDVTISFLQEICMSTRTLRNLVLEYCGMIQEHEIHTLQEIIRPREVKIFCTGLSTQPSAMENVNNYRPIISGIYYYRENYH